MIIKKKKKLLGRVFTCEDQIEIKNTEVLTKVALLYMYNVYVGVKYVNN